MPCAKARWAEQHALGKGCGRIVLAGGIERQEAGGGFHDTQRSEPSQRPEQAREGVRAGGQTLGSHLSRIGIERLESPEDHVAAGRMNNLLLVAPGDHKRRKLPARGPEAIEKTSVRGAPALLPARSHNAEIRG